MTLPWPWSVPWLPFSRACRPNSDITTTVTRPRRLAPDMSAWNAARESASPRIVVAIPPVAGPCALCVSQPLTSIWIASTPTSARMRAAVDRIAVPKLEVG